MGQYISQSLRSLVRERADFRCEYCLLSEVDAALPHEPDHIIAIKHGGETIESNLALACFSCNRRKGTDLASVDPDSGSITRLFNPRTDSLDEHYQLNPEGLFVPLTGVARTTIFLLEINDDERILIRLRLNRAKRFPK